MNPRYRKLGERLGEGSYKTVTKAVDEEEGKEVAYNEVRIKIYEEDTQAGNSFSKEIALLKNINHPNIIKILDYWFTDDNFVFVTELMTGGTLRDYINKVGPLNCKLIRKWGKQILEGLRYLHTLDPPIIHRDIKNENIFVNSSQGEIKIGDLGIARERKYKRYTIVGTPNFMAREMFEGEGYSEKVDVYAFGMCLIEMATGSMPYSELSGSNEVYRCVLQGVLPKALHAVGNCCLRSLIMNCLVAQPNRYSAEQCLAHHFFYPETPCQGDCLPRGCATILPVVDASGGMELSLVSFVDSVMTFQLVLTGSLRFIKFDYDLDCDTLEKVSKEMLDERIIEGEALDVFAELLEKGIQIALSKRAMGQIRDGIIELDGRDESVGEEIVLKALANKDDRQIEQEQGEKFGFGDKTLEVMKEIDEEIRQLEQQKSAEKRRDQEVLHRLKKKLGVDVEAVGVEESEVAEGIKKMGVRPFDSVVSDEGNDSSIDYGECSQKYTSNCSLQQFVLDAAGITGRSEETAKSWLKSLRDESLESVFDLKLLAYEDWERLPLTVFSCRVMQNMLYGLDNVPLREKQLPMNPGTKDYENRVSIREFLGDVCAEIGRGELAARWENKLMAQDVRTVGELRSLHKDDWGRLGLPVFAYRVLRNVIFQRGKITSV